MPPSLTALTLRDRGPLLSGLGLVLPEGLRELRLLGSWDRPVDSLRLPPRLEFLAFGDRFNQPLDQLDLPPSLTELHLGCTIFAKFAQSVSSLRLPAGLRVLSLPTFGRADNPDLLLPPAAPPLPPSLCELRVHPNGVKFDRLAQWELPPRCVVSTATQ
jgi:hypothetical protein